MNVPLQTHQASHPLGTEKTVALIELGDAHAVNISSQLQFLHHGGYTVHLLCSDSLREQVIGLNFVHQFAFFPPGDDFTGHWKCVFAVRRYLKHHGIVKVIFNTGEGNHTRDICLVTPFGTRFLGILHHTDKFKDSFTQFLISTRVHRYIVLNDYLLDFIPRSRRKNVESVYLIFNHPSEKGTAEKDPRELWVGIPGEVDFRRKDYLALINAANTTSLDPSVRFVLVGACKSDREDARQMRDLITQHGLEKRFTLFDGFVDPGTFFRYIAQCDLLLPLIHPSTSVFLTYKRFQISGTYNLSFGMAKPMLMHEALRGPEDFQVAAFFYGEGELVGLLNRLAANRQEYQAKAGLIESCKKFAFETQCERYLSFLGQT